MQNGMPYGNTFLAQTPKLDQLHNRLIAEQQQRELQQRQDSKMLDEEFSRNLSNIRDVDIPELTQKYGEYKQAWQNLYKKKGGGTPQEQLEVLKKKANMYSLLQGSKDKRNELDIAQKDLQKNPYNFLEGAHKTLIDASKTPTSQLKDDIYSQILDNGYGTDFTKAKAAAFGKYGERNSITQPTDNGASNTTTKYKGINSPSEILQNLQGSIRGDRMTNHFIKQHDYTDEEANRIISDYEKLKQTPEFKATYPNEPDIPPYLLTTPLGKAMTLTAMQQAVSNPPIAEVGKPVQTIANKQAFTLQKQANQDKLIRGRMALQNYYTTGHIDYKHNLDVQDYLATEQGAQDAFDNLGNNLPAWLIKQNYSVGKDEKGHENEYPNKAIRSADGKTVTIGYDDGKGGVNNGKPFSAESLKDQYKQHILGALKAKAPTGNQINISDVPTGTKLDQKNGKYYYKGREVKM